jgi:hypothetical protein
MADDKPNPDEEEVAAYSDATVSKAFRISLAAFMLLVTGASAAYFISKRKAEAPAPKLTQLAAPAAKEIEKGVEIPAVQFTDVTALAGITFKHNSGAQGEKLLPETMGGGAAFFDFDNDTDQDLLFINATYWPGKTPSGRQPTTAALYRNDGKGLFVDVTAGSGLDVPLYGMGVATGDFDRDGLVDVLITGVGGCRLFKNMGGKFEDVTASAGVGGAANDWSTAAAWFDLDNDGDLDLYVGNYVRWSPEIDREVDYKLVGVGRAYGQPMNFEGAFPHLYRNDGGGKFTEITAQAGLQVKNSATGVPTAKTLGVVPVDVDGDGYVDLIVANDTVQNHLFHNQKNGTFKEIGASAGIAFDSYGATRGAMGIDAAKYRDGDEVGIAIGNFANEMTALYLSQGKALSFADEAITEGIGPASRLPLKFGVFFFDYDLDGRLDLLTCNGHLDEDIVKVQASQKYAQSAQLFWNCGPTKKGCFVPVDQTKAGADIFRPIVGRGCAYADIDGDGDLDVLLLQTGGAPILLRNEQKLNHAFLRLKLIGEKSNPDAIGAWVTVKAGGKTLKRHVSPTRGYLSQSELPVTFGLGDAKAVDSIEIRWPSGHVTTINESDALALMVNRYIQVKEDVR